MTTDQPVNRLLTRLEEVKETAAGRWIARCPGHEDSSPSLSIRVLPDDKVLLHDFGGCAPADVLAAVGLSLQDLFPDGGREYRPGHLKRPRIPAADLLLIAANEITVAWLVADRMVSLRPIEADDWVRLKKAVSRLARIAAEVQPMTQALER